MNKTAHRIYIAILSIIVMVALAVLNNKGYAYYKISMEERFFHPDHTSLKPSGILGHGMGIIGSLFMILGVSLYMARKRYRIFSRLGFPGSFQRLFGVHVFLILGGRNVLREDGASDDTREENSVRNPPVNGFFCCHDNLL